MSENMHDDISKVLYTKEDLENIVSRLGKQITEDYRGKNLVLVCILKGSVIFTADLMRHIDLPTYIEFMRTSSYKNKTVGGDPSLSLDISLDLTGLDILIVEDILDSGRTLDMVYRSLSVRNPSSLKICTLFDKPSRRIPGIDVKADYFGAEVPDEFIVGYGLDFDEKYRNLPYIGVLKEEATHGIVQ